MVPSETAVARLVRVIAHAVAVFGDQEKAVNWLATPLAILENRTPTELFDSEEGIELVERTLTRIEHNIHPDGPPRMPFATNGRGTSLCATIAKWASRELSPS